LDQKLGSSWRTCCNKFAGGRRRVTRTPPSRSLTQITAVRQQVPENGCGPILRGGSNLVQGRAGSQNSKSPTAPCAGDRTRRSVSPRRSVQLPAALDDLMQAKHKMHRRNVDVVSGCGMLRGEPSHEPIGEIRMARRRGQQKGYVHRQGNAWYVAYREDALDADGKIVRVRRNERIADAKEVSKREAQRIAREILVRVDEQSQQPSSLITVEQFIKTRFEPDVIWSLKHAGQLHYRNMLKHVIPAIGQMRLRDVTSDHVQDLVRMKSKPVIQYKR